MRRRHRGTVLAVLGILIVVVFAVTLMVGKSFYGPAEVFRVILGETVPGASFTVGELRLPRATHGRARRVRLRHRAA